MNSEIIKVCLVALVGTLVTVGVCGCSKSAKEYYDRGVVRFERKETSGAISDFTRAIKKNPGYGMAYYYRAMAYNQKKERDKAIVRNSGRER